MNHGALWSLTFQFRQALLRPIRETHKLSGAERICCPRASVHVSSHANCCLTHTGLLVFSLHPPAPSPPHLGDYHGFLFFSLFFLSFLFVFFFYLFAFLFVFSFYLFAFLFVFSFYLFAFLFVFSSYLFAFLFVFSFYLFAFLFVFSSYLFAFLFFFFYLFPFFFLFKKASLYRACSFLQDGPGFLITFHDVIHEGIRLKCPSRSRRDRDGVFS